MTVLPHLLKRTADLIFSAVAILLLSPILIITASILKLTGEHHIIYKQRRVGRDYETLNIYKFATMRADSPKFGTITAKHDPRVLPVGRVLRKTKINELPQLFNILFGQMSIVGPRPLVESEVQMYPESSRHLIYRDNQPGLTGMGSLFFRDEEDVIEATGKPPERAYREDIMPLKGQLEVWYRSHKNLFLDLKLIFLTAWAVVSPHTAPVIESFRNAQGLPEEVLDRYEALVTGVE